MKKLLTLFFVFITVISYSQIYWNYNINFEDTSQLFRIEIDTLSNPNNIWQIGAPQKITFTSSYSHPNVIITDTANSYPSNDTSSFIIKHIAQMGFQKPNIVVLSGWYYIDSDTLSDYGMIEFSPDNGISWIDLLNDSILIDTAYNLYWKWNPTNGSPKKPTLSGNSGEWKFFITFLAILGPAYNIQYGDTVLYKFSFISDSIQTNKDGLMFDDLGFEDWDSGIEEIGLEFFKSECYPNPTKDVITIKFKNSEKSNFELFVSDITGKQILNQTKIKSNQLSFSVADFKKGIYIYKLVNKKEQRFSRGRFVKN